MHVLGASLEVSIGSIFSKAHGAVVVIIHTRWCNLQETIPAPASGNRSLLEHKRTQFSFRRLDYVAKFSIEVMPAKSRKHRNRIAFDSR